MGLWFTPGQGKHGVKIKRLEKFQTMAEKAKNKKLLNESSAHVPVSDSLHIRLKPNEDDEK